MTVSSTDSWHCDKPKHSVTDATAEKSARASLMSAVTRQLSPDRIVIFDGMNYIKGFRYQLYCAAREYKCRTCTVSLERLVEMERDIH